MARPKKLLSLQTGNLTKVQKIEKERIENAVKVDKKIIKTPPKWLINEMAIKEYKRVVKEMESLNILTSLDVNNLGAYCNAYALYLQATDELKGQGLTVTKHLPNGSYTVVANPLIKVQKDYSSEMRSYASLVGLTIDSRLKIGSFAIEKEDEKINKRFGDI